MNIFQYVETSKTDKHSISYEIERNYIKAYVITLHRTQIGNRYINYYVKRNTGLSKMLSDETSLFIFLNEKVSNLIRIINSNLFELDDMFNVIKQYKYLLDCSALSGVASLKIDNYESVRDLSQDYSFGEHSFFWGGTNIEGRIAIKINYFEFASENRILKDLKTLIKYADNVTKDALQIKIDFSKLKRRETEDGLIESLPPYLQKMVMYGGVFLLKAAVRSIGADIDANVDIDVDIPDLPDVDGIDINSNSVDFEFDNDNSEMCDFSAVPFGHAPNDGSYTKTNQDVTIQVAGGNDKGSYHVFSHKGEKYIDFKEQWVNIQGKTRFHLLGNDYIIKS